MRIPINVQNFELDSFTQRVVATPKENSRPSFKLANVDSYVERVFKAAK